MKLALLLAAGLVLSGCNAVFCKPKEPKDIHVAPECLTSCKADEGIITDDPNTLVEYSNRCEARRQLCENAIRRAQQAGEIK